MQLVFINANQSKWEPKKIMNSPEVRKERIYFIAKIKTKKNKELSYLI